MYFKSVIDSMFCVYFFTFQILFHYDPTIDQEDIYKIQIFNSTHYSVNYR